MLVDSRGSGCGWTDSRIGLPTTIASIQINDGSAQRSELRSLTVTFTGAVNFADGPASAPSAFQLQDLQNGTNVGLATAISTNAQGQSVVTLTFSGADTDPTTL